MTSSPEGEIERIRTSSSSLVNAACRLENSTAMAWAGLAGRAATGMGDGLIKGMDAAGAESQPADLGLCASEEVPRLNVDGPDATVGGVGAEAGEIGLVNGVENTPPGVGTEGFWTGGRV